MVIVRRARYGTDRNGTMQPGGRTIWELATPSAFVASGSGFHEIVSTARENSSRLDGTAAMIVCHVQAIAAGP